MLKSHRFQIDFGDEANGRNGESGAEFIVASPRAWTTLKLMLAPNLSVGESYVSGQWFLKRGRLSDFLHAIAQDANASFRRYYRIMSLMKGARFWLGQYFLNRYYTRKVKQHYDLDSKIYEMILDPEMLYTCAFFVDDRDTLDSAQQNKLAAAIDRMSFPTRHPQVLDIGCGWGGMARAIVRKHENAKVCGLSISKNQLAWAKQRDGYCLLKTQAERIEYRLEDYVDHDRSNYYDAISVIGMIEHVGSLRFIAS
jgi:cyclopropane-fatty-acyl-phospholipid synthase